MRKGNPTTRTQEEVLKVVRKNSPMSLTAIAEQTKKSIYQVKASIEFLEKLGIVKTIVSSGNTTFVIFEKQKEQKNA